MEEHNGSVALVDTKILEKINESIKLQNQGNFDEAIQVLQHIEAPAETQSSIYNNLGCLYFEKGAFEQAKSYLRKSIEESGTNVEAYQNFADLYFYLNDYENAFLIYEKLYRIQPDAEIIERIGDCLVGMDKIETANSFYKQAFELNPNNQAVAHKLELITAAILPLDLNVNVPSLLKSKITVTCYLPEFWEKSVNECNSKNLIKLLSHLHQDKKFSINLVTMNGSSPDDVRIPTLSFDKFVNTNQNLLTDIFISMKDLGIFERQLNAKSKILLTDARFNDDELKKVQSFINDMKIDYFLLSTNLNRQAFIDSIKVSDHDIRYMDINHDDEKNNLEWLMQYFETNLVEMTAYYVDKLILSDNPLKARFILDDSMLKLKERSEFQELSDKIDNLYPQSANPETYQQVYESNAKVTEFNRAVEEHPCYLWLIEQLKNEGQILKILDIGCHKGEFSISLAQLGYQVTGIDIAQSNITAAREQAAKRLLTEEHVKFIAGDAEKLSQYIQNEKFDAVLLFQTMEHIQDINAVLVEAEKVLKDQAKMFITIDAQPHEALKTEILKYPAARKYLRTFTESELAQLFSNTNDFKFQEIRSGYKRWYGVNLSLKKPVCNIHQDETAGKTPEDLEVQQLNAMLDQAIDYINKNETKQAFAIFLNMLEINPNQPKILYNAAILSDQMGERETTLEVLQNVIALAPAMSEPHNYLGKIYYQEGRYMLALEQFKTAISKDINHKEYYDNYKLAADRLGIQTVDPGTDIVFYTSGPPFNGNSNYQKGIGGSENALINMSRELARFGYNVRVFNNCDQPGFYDGVQYNGLTDFHIFRHFNHIKTLVSLRSLKPFKSKLNADLKILWIQDNTKVLFLQNEKLSDLNIDKIFAVSQWQKQDWVQHFKLPDNKFFITRNGIDSTFPEISDLTREPYKMVYISRPERGLATLLQMFPKIKKSIPEAELHVYSYRFDEKNEEIEKFTQMTNHPGIILKGSLTKQKLMNELKTAMIMVYPTNHLETSCTAAIEAQAAGLPVISSQLGALTETVVHGETGILIPGDPASESYQTDFIQAIVKLLTEKAEWEKMSENARRHAQDHYQWQTIANEWMNELKVLVKKTA